MNLYELLELEENSRVIKRNGQNKIEALTEKIESCSNSYDKIKYIKETEQEITWYFD